MASNGSKPLWPYLAQALQRLRGLQSWMACRMGRGNVAAAAVNVSMARKIGAMTNTCPAKLPLTRPQTSSLRCRPGQDAAEAQSRQWVATFCEKTAQYLGLPWPLQPAGAAVPPARAPRLNRAPAKAPAGL